MRLLSFLISSVVTVLLIFFLNKKWGSIPPLGRFLSPQQGFWQNAEPVDGNRDERFSFPELKGNVNVYLDKRLVPHVFAEKDEDAYFVQGFLHAKYRLWQMEFQTMAAAGRLSEILGKDARILRYDREQRRMGLGYAAENAVKAIDAEPDSKIFFDAYTRGVNAYIRQLTESNLPVEYKILDYRPEAWSNLKIALFLKTMSKVLSGFENDLEYTNDKSVFTAGEMNLLFPQLSDSSAPIVSKGVLFNSPSFIPQKPALADSLYFGKDTVIHSKEVNKPDINNGSNNWAVSGKKTRSGVPILCNDPHLDLTLPSIWYEMQLTTPTMNVYGATFPGTPSIIIGFNDSIAFGFTNAQRDVKDYYTIKFRDRSKKQYLFNGKWQDSHLRIEKIGVRGNDDFHDTVAYTVFGPVIYDESFSASSDENKALAIRWSAHDSSNEGAMWFKLDRAKNYNDYLDAIKRFTCPGQNMIFASSNGDIALWQQGKFPARWEGQGLYVMPGEDSSFMWQGYIPQEENPHTLNPEAGYIESANQRPVDSSYPYFIPGNYIMSRGYTLNKRLSQKNNMTIRDMMSMQNDYFNSTASEAVPLFLKYIKANELDDKEAGYLNEIRTWNYYDDAASRPATIFQAWLDSFHAVIYNDEFSQIKSHEIVLPEVQTMLESILKDSMYKYIDDIRTPQTETIFQQVTKAFHMASSELKKEEAKNGLAWWKHKNVTIYHLLRTALLPFGRTGIEVGGWSNTVNAIMNTHGPSWRMIVQLNHLVEAYGVYPGGQSGNPGSMFYDNFIDNWARGRYYTLWMMKESENKDKKLIGVLTFKNS